MTQTDSDRTAIGPVRRSHLQGDVKECRFSVVSGVSGQARKLWVAVGSTHQDARIRIENIRIDFLQHPQGESVPGGAAGLVYQQVEDIPTLIREVADHYPHYRRTAAEFARHWRSFHNADRLVADISQNTGNGSDRAAEVARTVQAGGERVADQDIACA
jgi:hypothetical protein